MAVRNAAGALRLALTPPWHIHGLPNQQTQPNSRGIPPRRSPTQCPPAPWEAVESTQTQARSA